MKNGRPNGECTYYYPSGETLVSGQFNLGHFAGTWKEYSITGEILFTTEFKPLILEE